MAKGRYDFRVRSYECGPDGRATLPSVCNYLQEAASVNAEELGFSKVNFAAAGANLSWVLTKLVVKMRRYPVWNDVATVETFPRGGRRIVAWRDFELKSAEGETLGVASSEWMLIDLGTRKIETIPDAVMEASDPTNEPVLGLEPFTRFKFPAAAAPETPDTFRAQKSHIDLNGHVNNVHYIEWLLESCPTACPQELEIVFRSETLAGDEVLSARADAAGVSFHRVYARDGRDHVTARTCW